MPELDFSFWSKIPAVIVPWSGVVATMIYPKNPHRRQELFGTLVADEVFRTADSPGEWLRRFSATDFLPLLKARHEGRARKEVFRYARMGSSQGFIAGEILFLVRNLVAQGEPGGILKACYMIAEAAKQEKLTFSLTEISYKNPQALMEKIWAPYKSVGHLWAAYSLRRGWTLSCGAGGILQEDMPWDGDTSSFLEFLATAEDFRQFGERHISHARTVPLLSPKATSRVPAHVQLPAPPPYDPPPLRLWYQQALASYRA